MKTQSSYSSRSPQSAPAASDTSVGHALDPTAPPALWRLIQIGETAGLVTPADEDAIAEAFGTSARRRACVGRALAAFQWSETELYILVTLFSAARHSVSVPVIARETLADAVALRTALRHLEAVAATSLVFVAKGEPAAVLNPSGRSLAVMLIYRVLHSALSHQTHAEFAASTQAADQRNFHGDPLEPSASSTTRRLP